MYKEDEVQEITAAITPPEKSCCVIFNQTFVTYTGRTH